MACHLFRRQAISWSNPVLLLIGLPGTSFCAIWIDYLYEANNINFIQENAFENVFCQKSDHFVPTEIS